MVFCTPFPDVCVCRSTEHAVLVILVEVLRWRVL